MLGGKQLSQIMSSRNSLKIKCNSSSGIAEALQKARENLVGGFSLVFSDFLEASKCIKWATWQQSLNSASSFTCYLSIRAAPTLKPGQSDRCILCKPYAIE